MLLRFYHPLGPAQDQSLENPVCGGLPVAPTAVVSLISPASGPFSRATSAQQHLPGRGEYCMQIIQDLHLTAWRLLGIPSEHMEFLTMLLPWLSQGGDPPPSPLRTLDLPDSEDGVQTTRLLLQRFLCSRSPSS